MADVSIERLESAFMNAHKAGDKKNAKILADEIKIRRAAETQDVSAVADVSKSGGSGFLKGLVGIPGVPGSIEEILKNLAYSSSQKAYALPESEKAQVRDLEILGSPVGAMVDKPPVKPTQVLPTYSDVISGAASMLPEQLKPALTYEPKTAPGRIAGIAGEFTGGALFPGSLTKNVLKNVLPYTAVGATAGAIEEVEPGYGGPAGMALTVPVALVQARKGRATKILEDIKSAGPEAIALQAAGREVGVPLSAAETLGSKQVKTLAEQTAKQPSAASILNPMIEARATQVPSAQAGLLDDISPATTDPRAVSRQAQEAASAEMAAVKKQRKEVTSPLYEAAGKKIVSEPAIDELIALAREAKKGVSPGGPTSKAIDTFISRISTPTKAKKPKGLKSVKTEISVSQPSRKPVVEVDRLESARKEFAQKLELDPATNSKAMLSEAKGVIGGKLNKKLDDILIKVPELRTARQTHQEITENIVNAVGDSGAAAMAKANIKPGKAADIISPASKENRPKTISAVADSLNKQDETVFPKLARYWLENTVFKAPRDANIGVVFEKAARGEGIQAQNFDAMIAGVAKAKGQDPKRVVTAVNKVMDVLKATGETKALRTPSGATESVKAEGGLLSRGALGITETISNKIRNMGAKKFYKQFAEAMVADDSINALEKLARTNATRDQYAAFLNTLIVPARDTTGGLLAGD